VPGEAEEGHEHAVTVAKPEVSARARLIIEGLIRTRRGSDPHIAGAYVRLRSKIDGFYWVRVDGSRLLRGDSIDDAEQLQKSFTETMVRAGE
jgi:hypothetical protein